LIPLHREKGYSKTGKIREIIQKSVKEKLKSVKVSASAARQSHRSFFLSFLALVPGVSFIRFVAITSAEL